MRVPRVGRGNVNLLGLHARIPPVSTFGEIRSRAHNMPPPHPRCIAHGWAKYGP